ncbi:hypothetical protein A8C32_00680 [Flavivirga aquatica]|uniref:GlsB/YeaQ/YmgE family stress response membrane protein n=1 Tax=Flavivirga aquatica TaxID=1849968 RepID=A0A1E5TBS0_9FLAO|nr:hypothetical protein [Flavivirga aquatica]OEK08824.1 hypothetical protein A8C32_00680 [Flavivirga aquatica]
MTDTLISLISIIVGIVGTNVFGLLYRKYNIGLIGNTIAGVFGSILFIKVFGRLGFDPVSIMKPRIFNAFLFVINMIVSLLGGVLLVVFIKKKGIK